jgi:hypothetical protein
MRASSSSGRALVLQPRGCWFEPSLAHWRIAQVAEHLSDTEEAAGSSPAPPILRDRSSARVERPPETRGVAGSIPAGHIRGSVAQMAELPPLKRRVAGSTPAGATHGRTATGAVSRLENGWVSQPWGFDSPSFRLCGGMAELARQRVATA